MEHRINPDMWRFGWVILVALSALPRVNAAPGDGIRLGQTVVSPALQLNVSYDSNVKHQSDALATQLNTDLDGELATSAVIEVRPSIGAAFKNEDVKLLASVEDLIRQFTATSVAPLSYYDDVVASATVELFYQNRLGLLVRDDFTNHNYVPRGYADADSQTGARRYNNLLVEGRYSPGSALDLTLGAHWFRDVQELLTSDISADVATASGAPAYKNEFGLQARGKWRFFPRTSIIAEADYSRGQWTQVPTCTSPGSAADGTGCAEVYQIPEGTKSAVDQWSAFAGISGQFTDHIQANVFAGYGGLYNTSNLEADNVSGLKGLLGQVQVVFTPLETHSLEAGFTRRFGDSATQDYAIYNSFMVGYNGLYLGRLAVNALVSFDRREQNSAQPSEVDTRIDTMLSGRFGVDYQISPGLTARSWFIPTLVASAPDSGVSPNTADYYATAYGFQQFVVGAGVRGVY